MKKSFLAAILLAAIGFLFSSCGSGSFIRPAGSLLTPPLYYEEYEDLVEAFNRNVAKEAVFCNPSGGDYRSAIIIEDIDSDGETEAIIFYKDSIDDTVARMHLFDVVEGNWISSGDFNGYGNGVDGITITDMDDDGSSEFVVIWGISGMSSGSVMSVYRSSLRTMDYKEISNEICAASEVLDIDGDSRKEIFYITQNNAATSPNSAVVTQRFARVMRVSGDSVVLMGEARVDSNISRYTEIKTEKSSEDSPLRIYVDALKGEQQMITELIYWDSEKAQLYAPLLDQETMANTATLRYEPIACADIDNDGIIDIPVQSQVFGGGDDSSTIDTESIYLTQWTDFSLQETKTVANTLINYPDGYMVFLDDDEIESIGIRNYRSQNCWVVYETDSSGESIGELFSVLKIAADRWNTDIFYAYIPIVERADGVVCVYITQNGTNLGIDEETIKTKITKLPG